MNNQAWTCNSCRKRKQSCDENFPCYRCTNLKRECVRPGLVGKLQTEVEQLNALLLQERTRVAELTSIVSDQQVKLEREQCRWKCTIPNEFNNIVDQLSGKCIDEERISAIAKLADEKLVYCDYTTYCVHFDDEFLYAVLCYFKRISAALPFINERDLKCAAVDLKSNIRVFGRSNFTEILLFIMMSIVLDNVLFSRIVLSDDVRSSLNDCAINLTQQAAAELAAGEGLWFPGENTIICMVQCNFFFYLKFRQASPVVASAYLHRALLQALRCGLHNEDCYEGINNIEAEVRRTLWWIVFMYNIFEKDNVHYQSLYIFDISVRAPECQSDFSRLVSSFRVNFLPYLRV